MRHISSTLSWMVPSRPRKPRATLPIGHFRRPQCRCEAHLDSRARMVSLLDNLRVALATNRYCHAVGPWARSNSLCMDNNKTWATTSRFRWQWVLLLGSLSHTSIVDSSSSWAIPHRSRHWLRNFPPVFSNSIRAVSRSSRQDSVSTQGVASNSHLRQRNFNQVFYSTLRPVR